MKTKRGTKARMTWNHRVVRRYRKNPPDMMKILGKETVWLELTEVHYRNGKPIAFALDYHNLMGGGEPGQSDESALSDMADDLRLYVKALAMPILDEKRDFKGVRRNVATANAK